MFSAYSASLLLHHPTLTGPQSDLLALARQRTSGHAEEILDIAYFAQLHPDSANYMLPHSLLLAARVRLAELLERKGHYRGRDMDLLITGLLTFGRHWGLEGEWT
jgi:hypothetical protein